MEIAPGTEVERRIAERDVADRRYNDALTRVDRELPRPPDPSAATVPVNVDSRSVRERTVILPPAPLDASGWRGRLTRFVWRLVAPVFTRQQEFNTVVADHLEQMSAALRRVASALPEAREGQRAEFEAFVSFNSVLVQYLQQITPFIDTKVRVLETSLDAVKMAAISAQRTATAARRKLDEQDGARQPPRDRQPELADRTAVTRESPSLGAAYVGFEDLFRGTPADIRARQSDYADRFTGASDIVDIGCGRGEFLELLRDRGVSAVGVDINPEMVDECRSRGLRALEGDGLAYIAGLPDDSVGGLTAFQVVEHLDPDRLVRLLQTAFVKLRPGGTLILETINAACWVAFFESYLRDITHVRPLHPDTLKFLVIAAGFESVDIHFRSPVDEAGRLHRAAADALPPPLANVVQTMNANVDRLNERLFTYLDYAIVATKGR